MSKVKVGDIVLLADGSKEIIAKVQSEGIYPIITFNRLMYTKDLKYFQDGNSGPKDIVAVIGKLSNGDSIWDEDENEFIYYEESFHRSMRYNYKGELLNPEKKKKYSNEGLYSDGDSDGY